MALDVRHDYHAVGGEHPAGYLGGLEAGAGAWQRDFPPVVALEAVGYDDGRPADFGNETVGYGGLKVVDRVGALARIQRVGVGEERLGADTTREVGCGPREYRADVGVVSYLAEMDLYSAEVALPDGIGGAFGEPGQQGADLGYRTCPGAPGSGVHVVYRYGHVVSLE